jgi:UDP:flavonoid glycosyltransferase YjiC (YdhE family)
MNVPHPMRIVLATVGSRGDVQPMLAIAQVLRARGHVPVVAAPVNFENWIRSAGFEFAPLGGDMQAYLSTHPEILTGNPLKNGRQSFAFFKTHVPMQAPQLFAACQGADAVLYAGLSVFFAPSVAQALRLPAMQVQFTTCLLPGKDYPPPAYPWHGLPRWLNNALWYLHLRGGNWAMLPTLNAMRASLPCGHTLPPLADAWHNVLYSNPLVIAADAQLLPPQAAWRDRFAYTGFLFLDDPRPLDAGLQEWLADGEPPVYIGFGSMSGAATTRLEPLLKAALLGSGRRVLIGAGWAGLATKGELPDGWRVVQDAPHALLFQHVAVVVHHGGSGTTAQALRAGVPQVALPLILDQFHHAHRLHQCALTPRPVPLEKVTAQQLRAAIDAALAMPAGPRHQFAQRLQQSRAGLDISLRLEALVCGDGTPKNPPPGAPWRV